MRLEQPLVLVLPLVQMLVLVLVQVLAPNQMDSVLLACLKLLVPHRLLARKKTHRRKDPAQM